MSFCKRLILPSILWAVSVPLVAAGAAERLLEVAQTEATADQGSTTAIPVAAAGVVDYQAALWNPLHFRPAIEQATDEQCLACHAEVLERRVLERSPAGVEASTALAWYQTLHSYDGDQETFHRRHLATAYSQQVMDLGCNFCHQGADPREEAPNPPTAGDAGFTLRKQVDPEQSCLLCHGAFPYEVMDGVEGSWAETRADFEFEEGENGCLVCHEELFRTVRHQVDYLNAEAIEAAAATNSDVCYGCHGGRAWYRISYPYPRHPWPDMDEEVPEWAKDRPTRSDERYELSAD